ncbi:UDP-N-acetylglucosamine 2-epimerase (non-hydrolyzing) [Campylobacter sp. RM9344]|uniref:UDP-N-acetylglucosamine 2-epimerase (non-hydrolyzing) n=1 Tax=Campylobacter californiensis TaxID=1032243 RepID=A0AAW3ZUS1_9BACT|nr:MULTISPECIES: UDP-N-acetylglucosamine 2-epimerase (non-hydrolyzing) [unclassified Campylobacter]MBE2983891.1 UDP-N-acetylglucosamine 2-epimerase (non-hydrolyzing) [Campylobacter sp. RM6883]MBE2994429.1 UDP-N-acetylglucosamine 2-epimerase (non-hydrolyzing) [Campylobacter sp. RM6913]MBE3028737.1 UDP-N-acetylglucosamine 2-epimerase (non-hydrolyzing) [Campylobacter sp. RM9344]MBE3607626.1 UDP-N-acetylglucosamine 2-epimerase (non-hydrolyzing) [Campylobacter sp. RM9337]QCD51018.1 UDP-N-acetylgluc
MKKILIVFGTRPEAIKMVPLVKEFKKYLWFEIKVCVTAQHRHMLDQVLEIFDVKPDYDLDIMRSGQDLYDLTARILIKMRDVLEDFKPDIVFVHGDTTTASSTALAAFYKQIKIAHIEAGLRTGNIYSPFPEEINRQMIGIMASYHFAPTNLSKGNLLKENKDEKNIEVVGNTVIDALFLLLNMMDKNSDFKNKILTLLNLKYNLNHDRKIILVTGHRRENFGDGFINICNALKDIATKNPDIDIVYPVHLNPNVQKPVSDILSNTKNVYLIAPLEYSEFVYLMSRAYFIITDSGGVQEEAPSLGKPVLVMRDTTERPEALQAGTVKLVGVDRVKIVSEAQKLLDNIDVYSKMSKAHNPYGDGSACAKIVDFIKNLG